MSSQTPSLQAARHFDLELLVSRTMSSELLLFVSHLMALGLDLGQHSLVRTLGRLGFQNPVMRPLWAAQIQSWLLCVSTQSAAGEGPHP